MWVKGLNTSNGIHDTGTKLHTHYTEVERVVWNLHTHMHTPHIHTDPNRQTDRHTDLYRHIVTQTHTQTDTDTDTHRPGLQYSGV